jgi:drug/metabolite transporter (DMT)-like permease
VSDLNRQHGSPSRAKIVLAYLSVFIIWGSTYLAIRIGVQDIPPALFAGLRFMIAALLLFIYGRITTRTFPQTRRDIAVHAIVGIFLLVGGNGLVVWSEQWVHSGLAAVIIASVPLFMSSVDALIPGGHRLSFIGWVGILIGFGGVVYLVFPALRGAEGSELHPAGIAGLIVASFFWSIGSVFSKRQAAGGDVLINTAIQMFSGGAGLLLIALLTNELPEMKVTWDGMLSLVYLIVFGSIIGFTSYAYLLRHVPPAKASTYAYVNPIVAVILGTALLAEPLTSRTIMATVIILGGVAIVQAARTRLR